jgi:hypothetical protein
MEKEAAKRPLPPAAHPPRSMAFKIFNDSILICRYQSATAPWDSAMDRGNLTDLTAFVLADRASFSVRGQEPAMGPGCAKTFFRPQKLHATGDDPRRHDFERIFAVSSLESTRAQARATLSDLNGHTMRITARALHARMAASNGLMPTMFITRVRL